jgi:phage shock protein PspC (stress-responsive transcriptional regulator)
MHEERAHQHVAPKKLARSRVNRILAGVCGGFGEYFGIDPVLVRVGWVILSLASGAGVLLYLASWVLIPKEQGVEIKIDTRENLKEFAGDVASRARSFSEEFHGNPGASSGQRRVERRIIFWALIAVAVALLLEQLAWPHRWNMMAGAWGFGFGPHWGVLVPLILVGAGLYFIFRRSKE